MVDSDWRGTDKVCGAEIRISILDGTKAKFMYGPSKKREQTRIIKDATGSSYLHTTFFIHSTPRDRRRKN